MRTMFRFVAILAVGLLAAPAGAQERPALDTEKDKLSYAIGADLGKDLRDRSIEVTPERLIEGIRDALAGGPMRMSEQEVQATVRALQQELRRKQALARAKLPEENKRKGKEFLEANKQQEGVIALESGLQYKILEQGEGPKPVASDVVEVHYRGTLVDGTEFASSYSRNRPGTFPVKRLMEGWRQALELMPVGSKWRLFIPPHLAYGVRGTGRRIGPNATLIFDIELLGIKDGRTVGVKQETADRSARDDQKTGPVVAAPTGIQVSFKLDPRLMGGGTYALRRWEWVAPETFRGLAGQETVEARAHGLDAAGSPHALAAEPSSG